MSDTYSEFRSGGREEARLLAQEELILEVTETLCERIQSLGITRTEVARRLGKSPGFVTQLLNGGRNLTLRTLADLAHALEARPSLKLAESHNLEALPSMAARDSRRVP
jgi:transcriptional regulator with XRE-family HTH domain